ncbi:hypothetical protein LOZ65_006846 [Ophidiomyces ophidiicola]|nr:hypothetical protein LOZ65_006846 [Ophidiomyces ophidiicola]
MAGEQSADGQQEQSDLDAAVDHGAGERLEGPFEGDAEQAEDDVEDLQDGDGLDRAIEIFRDKVPEHLGPEEAVDAGGKLDCRMDVRQASKKKRGQGFQRTDGCGEDD